MKALGMHESAISNHCEGHIMDKYPFFSLIVLIFSKI